VRDIRLVVLSGPSGAGKSTAVKALEDIGFYCVDNMPVALLPRFMELIDRSGEAARVAAVVDVREGGFLNALSGVIVELRETGYRVELLYLESSDDSLLKRFSETRRRHPLASDESPAEGIGREREILKEVRDLADRVMDTSGLNVHELRAMIKEVFSASAAIEKMTVNLVSFGYRYGIPADADMVMDVRFLPNPFFVDALRGLDGTDERVREFVLKSALADGFLDRFRTFLDFLVPLYRKEGKSYLTIAIGCTGGRHRSVVCADEICAHLASGSVTARTRHRDLMKP